MSALNNLQNKNRFGQITELELCVLMAGTLCDPNKAAEQLTTLETNCANAIQANIEVAQLNVAFQERIDFMEKKIDELNAPMPCGHLARYAVNEKAGTQYCSLCQNGAAYDELKNAALTVTKSFECYTAENKPESEYDEYDSWMLPAWKKLLSIVRGDK